jgi:hypothetical protein
MQKSPYLSSGKMKHTCRHIWTTSFLLGR